MLLNRLTLSDDQGRLYNAIGDLQQWWSNATIARFNQQAQCIANQYDTFVLDGYHVNGNLTLGEDIADNGGIQLAFRAYQNYVAANGKELPLPGLGLTPDQLFFVSFGQVWCTHTRPAEAIRRLFTDPHAPPQYRVTGALQNSQDFAATFQCPAGSPMNPVSKCQVW